MSDPQGADAGLRAPAMLHKKKKKTLARGCSTILQFYILFTSHFLFCSILKLSETKFLCCCEILKQRLGVTHSGCCWSSGFISVEHLNLRIENGPEGFNLFRKHFMKMALARVEHWQLITQQQI